MSRFVVVRIRSTGNEHIGAFDSKDEAWDWVNKKDPYRQEAWSIILLQDKESY